MGSTVFAIWTGVVASLLVAIGLAFWGNCRWASVLRSWLRFLPRKGRLAWHSRPLVIFVSAGGTCRDPMAKVIAESVVKQVAPALKRIRFEGRALMQTPSKQQASQAAQAAIREMLGSNSLETYVPLSISKNDIHRADLILVMSRDLIHKDVLPTDKTYLFKEFFGEQGDVVDPWPDGRDEATIQKYLAVAKDIHAVIEGGIDRLAHALQLPVEPPNNKMQ